ncbi:unnamed protein product [Phyllotreta striolata]|uniref:UDP-glucuronosyltransferase n=1 Tax=Phyllotreta striolata TaxID=444603 RepID=A0A9N9TRF0_PHYSR|nr:unnamed protein product [Phyllotreta striolata]
MRFQCICLFTSTLIGFVCGYKILIVSPLPSQSHYILCRGLAAGLVNAGHDVTFITPFNNNPPKGNGSFKYVAIGNCMEEFFKVGEKERNYFEIEKSSPLMNLPLMNVFGGVCMKQAFENENVKNLLRSNEKFDAVIMESLYTDGLAAFACHYNAPLIALNPVGSAQWINDPVGNPTPPSYVPSIFFGFSDRMDFWQRSQNYLYSIISSLGHKLYTYPSQSELVRKHFPNCPSVDEMQRNAALILSNSHESTNYATTRVPNIIDIGGFHVNPSTEKLPNELQKIMDSAKDGVIYFSLGSHVKPSHMPLEMKKAMIKVLGSLKQTILWKWDDDKFPDGAPSNIIVRKWFPQQQILAHPNVKLFITHGGLLSLTEAIHLGVPMLALPVIGDQKLNAIRAELLGVGKRLFFADLTEESFRSALNELLTNSKYNENVKYRSKLYHDRPVKPLDLAMYWIEYVIRHKGAPHLRVFGRELPWYTYYCVDVIVFWSTIISITLFIIFKLFKRICCSIRKDKKIKSS